MKKGLVKSIVAAVFAVLSFVGLAFNFVLVATSVGGKSSSASWSLGDWTKQLDSLADYKKLGGDTSKWVLWQIARVLMIIALIAVVVAVALAFVKVFVDNKVVNILLKVFSIVGLVVSIAFLVSFVGGGFLLYQSNSFGSITSTVTYLPNVGSIMVGVGSIVATALAIPCRKKASK